MILSKENNSLKDALEKFENSIIAQPDLLPSYIGKAEVLIKLNKFDEAINTLTEVLSKDSNFISAIFLLGVVYLERGDVNSDSSDYHKSMELFKKALEINNHHVDSLANIAYLNARMDNNDQFEEEFRKLFVNYPDHRDIIYNYLSISLKKLNYGKTMENLLEGLV